jgi:hypothetical protein
MLQPWCGRGQPMLFCFHSSMCALVLRCTSARTTIHHVCFVPQVRFMRDEGVACAWPVTSSLILVAVVLSSRWVTTRLPVRMALAADRADACCLLLADRRSGDGPLPLCSEPEPAINSTQTLACCAYSGFWPLGLGLALISSCNCQLSTVHRILGPLAATLVAVG